MGGERGANYLLYQQTVGALCATDYKWVQQEQVMQGKLVIEVQASGEAWKCQDWIYTTNAPQGGSKNTKRNQM